MSKKFAPEDIDKLDAIKDNHNTLKERVLVLERNSENFKENFDHTKITTDVQDIQSAKKVFMWGIPIVGVAILTLTGVILKYTYFALETKVEKIETSIVEIQRNNNCPNPPLPVQSFSSVAS